MTPELYLNFDIWDRITDILGVEIHQYYPENSEEPLKNLRDLSLTCKAIVPLCQKHLFSTILLSGSDTGRSVRFRDVTSDNPGLIVHIRNLTYMMYNPQDMKDDDHEILRAIIDHSTILQSLNLQSSRRQWDALPGSFQTSLIELVHLPTVKNLSIGGLARIPSHILAGCPNIIDLTLLNVDFTETEDYVEDAQYTRAPQLVRLNAQGRACSALRVLMQPRGHTNDRVLVDFSALKTMTISVSDILEDQKVVWDQVKKSRALETLDLSIAYSHRGVVLAGLGSALSTHTTPTLRRLEVYRHVYLNHDDPICGLPAELIKIAGSNVLEAISLNIAFMETTIPRTAIDDWAAFDSLVTTRGSFPGLKSVSIEILWYIRHGEESEAVVRDQITDERFPALSRSASVEFRFSVRNQSL